MSDAEFLGRKEDPPSSTKGVPAPQWGILSRPGRADLRIGRFFCFFISTPEELTPPTFPRGELVKMHVQYSKAFL